MTKFGKLRALLGVAGLISIAGIWIDTEIQSLPPKKEDLRKTVGTIQFQLRQGSSRVGYSWAFGLSEATSKDWVGFNCSRSGLTPCSGHDPWRQSLEGKPATVVWYAQRSLLQEFKTIYEIEVESKKVLAAESISSSPANWLGRIALFLIAVAIWRLLLPAKPLSVGEKK